MVDRGTEARIARIEAHVDHLREGLTELKAETREIKSDMKTDFRILFGAIITVAVGISGLLAKGFGWI